MKGGNRKRMKSRAFKIGVAVFVLALTLSLIAIRTYVLAVELDPLTGFAAPGQGNWQNIFLVVLLAGAAVTAVLCHMSGRLAEDTAETAPDAPERLPGFLRWAGVLAALVLTADAAAGVLSAMEGVGVVAGVLLTLVKLAVAYTVFIQSTAFARVAGIAYHPASAAVQAVPILYCIAILLNTFLNYVAFNSTSQHLLEQMSVIAVMLFFLGTFSFCLRVGRTADRILTVTAGLLGFLFLALSVLPPCLASFCTGILPAFLKGPVGLSPVAGFCLMGYMGLFSFYALLAEPPVKVRILGEQPQEKQ